MIWLSPMTGTKECSIYFDIRDIDLRRTGKTTEGVVRGLLGDGQRELWGEVCLSKNSHAQILPLWGDDGQIETFDDSVDESLLQSQLLAAVESLFARIATCDFIDQSSPEIPVVCESVDSCYRAA